MELNEVEKSDIGLNGVMEVKIKLKLTISGSRGFFLLVSHQTDIYSKLKRSWMTKFFSLTLPRT